MEKVKAAQSNINEQKQEVYIAYPQMPNDKVARRFIAFILMII